MGNYKKAIKALNSDWPYTPILHRSGNGVNIPSDLMININKPSVRIHLRVLSGTVEDDEDIRHRHTSNTDPHTNTSDAV